MKSCLPLKPKTHYTCGIVGVVAKKESKKNVDIVYEGLTILQNRGYDSAGIVTFNSKKKELIVSKFASKTSTDDAFDLLKDNLRNHEETSIGVGHTRWATHGGKTDENAHPHTDAKNRVALVHNGVIENYSILKEKLEKESGIVFRSETDTEVIAQLIGVHLDKDLTLEDSVLQTVSLLEGTWGIVVISLVEPDKLIACRCGSPLLIGLSDERVFVASESAAFGRYTRRMIELKNHELAVLTGEGVERIVGKDEQEDEKSRVVNIPKEDILLSPDPYPHWTIKEISEQPLSLHRSLNYGGRIEDECSVKLGGLDANEKWLKEIDHLIITGCGTSSFAGMYGAKVFRLLKAFSTVRVVDASDADMSDFPSSKGGILAISQSGETRDVMTCLSLAQESDVPIFSVVNKVGSLISRTTGCGVYINAGREIGVASTKAFTSQVTVLCLVGIWFSQHRKTAEQLRMSLISALHRLPTTIGMMVRRTRKDCQEIAKYLKDKHSCFVLGRGLGEAIAREGALKIKEITYLHAEAYSSGSLKHGPFALLDENVPVIIVVMNDKYFNHNVTCIEEVKARGAKVIAITDCAKKIKGLADMMVAVPTNGLLTYLNAVIPLQLIAYELSILKGINPDKPRHLAKTVTVG